jgi:hypothetical protein
MATTEPNSAVREYFETAEELARVRKERERVTDRVLQTEERLTRLSEVLSGFTGTFVYKDKILRIDPKGNPRVVIEDATIVAPR